VPSTAPRDATGVFSTAAGRDEVCSTPDEREREREKERERERERKRERERGRCAAHPKKGHLRRDPCIYF